MKRKPRKFIELMDGSFARRKDIILIEQGGPGMDRDARSMRITFRDGSVIWRNGDARRLRNRIEQREP